MPFVIDDLIILVVALLIAQALAPKPSQPKPATLEDFDFPKAEEGTPQMVVFGDTWIDGWMVLSYGELDYGGDPFYDNFGPEGPPATGTGTTGGSPGDSGGPAGGPGVEAGGPGTA